MQPCDQSERFTRLMSLAQDGCLDAEGRRELDRHLAVCPACRAQWAALERLAVLFDAADMVGPPLGFARRVERRLAERTRRRQRWFQGLAVLTGSLSLAGATAAVLALIALGFAAWNRMGGQVSVQQRVGAVSHIAAGVGLVGRGASLFLGDLLLRYGPPLVFLVALGLVVLAATWLWLYIGRPGGHRHNGYA
ncbi:MAG TPA: hypothetical protein ENJ31_00390 [Anaerolineae bacterium]|nr:hypothetical protein [Anaerolineae bacterium]